MMLLLEATTLLLFHLVGVVEGIWLDYSPSPGTSSITALVPVSFHCELTSEELASATSVHFRFEEDNFTLALEDDQTFEYTFKTPGRKTVSAIGYDGNGDSVLELDLDLIVNPASEWCVRYEAVGRSWLMAPSSEQYLELRAVYYREHDPLEIGLSPQSLTKEMIEMHDSPVVGIVGDLELSAAVIDCAEGHATCGNSVNSFALAEVSPGGTSWRTKVRSKNWVGTAWLRVTSSTKFSMGGRCGVESTVIPIHVTGFHGWNVSSWKDSERPKGLEVESDDSRVNFKGIDRDLCMPSSAVAWMENAQILISEDGFQTFAELDLTKHAIMKHSGQPMCAFLDCGDFAIEDLRLLSHNSLLVISKSFGLIGVYFESERAVVEQLLSLETGKALSFSSKGHCIGEPGPEAEAVFQDENFAHGTYVLHGEDLYHVLKRMDESAFHVQALHDRVKFFETAHRHLRGALFDPRDLDQHLFLFTEDENDQAFIGKTCELCEEKLPGLGFVFPVEATVNGICTHASGLAIFGFGDAMWISYDSGDHFEVTLTLEPGEFISHCPVSSATTGVYIVETSKGRAFYGQLSVTGLGSIFPGLGLQGKVLNLDSKNQLAWLYFRDGTVERSFVPISSLLSSYRLQIQNPVAFSGLYGSRIALKIHSEHESFGPQHEGMLLMPLGIQIYDVDMSTGVAYSMTEHWQHQYVSSESFINLAPEDMKLAIQTIVQDYPGSKCGLLSVSMQKVNSDDANLNVTSHFGILLPEVYGGASVFTIEDGLGICHFGSLRESQLTVNPGEWHQLDVNNFWLELKQCEIEKFSISPSFKSPVVRLMDRFDMFVLQATVSDPHANKNEALEGNLTWMSYDQPNIALTRTNPSKSFVTMFQYSGSNDHGAISKKGEYAVDENGTSFFTYQTIYPMYRSQMDIWFSEGNQESREYGVHNVIVSIESSRQELGRSTMLITAKETGLSCTHDSLGAIARLYVLCPTFKTLEYLPRTSSTDYSLPTNYRPPSYKGKGRPLSPHVYNADPSEPLYLDWFKESRDLARFKQCHNKTRRSECNCDISMENGTDVMHSDCIRRVEATVYSNFFVPTFVIQTNRDGTRTPLKSMYNLRDVNGRFDYCTNSTGFNSNVCGESSDIEQFGFNPNAYDAILFVGEGLYHFEVTINDPVSFCELKTHLLLFVLEPPMSTRIESITITVTGVTLMAIGLIAYLGYYSSRRLGIHDFTIHLHHNQT